MGTTHPLGPLDDWPDSLLAAVMGFRRIAHVAGSVSVRRQSSYAIAMRVGERAGLFRVGIGPTAEQITARNINPIPKPRNRR